ncbi:diguanylate cyclase [Bacillus sp. DJP31]|uniref:diguanylate cyclase n=1 Tax=Bacillus sp. DJP31 TaxID=3409789 RepID=UPI003BB59C4B
MHLFRNFPLTIDSKLPLKAFTGLSSGLLSVVLMFFAIHIDTTLIDLRHIPLMIVTLFGGFVPALIGTVVIIIGRFILGGYNVSSISALFLMLLLFIGFIAIGRLKVNLWIKASLQMTYTNIVFSIFLFFLVNDKSILTTLYPIYWTLTYASGFLSIYLVTFQRSMFTSYKIYQEQSSVDYLTGLNNYRKFDEIYNHSLENYHTRSEELTLFYLDIDHFKKVNDTFGHQNGDLVLKQLGEILQQNVRSFDTVSRNGGEEFSIILPDCSLSKGVSIAEKIRIQIENHPFVLASFEEISITVSIGVANIPSTSLPENLLEDADHALYEAKNSGRNKVMSAN